MTAAPAATIGSETIEQFVARHRNGVFTNDVAGRFGMHLTDARRALRQLQRDGKVISERETAGGNGSFAGAGLVWKSR